MRYDELVAYCLAKPGAWRDEPWDGVPVAKVGERVFAFLGTAGPEGTALDVRLKCGRDAEAAREWRERFPGEVKSAPYVGRFGWNSFATAGLPDDDLLEAVDGSYDAVVGRLARSRRPAG